MTALLLFFIAGICNAIMDTIAHHWSKSIFYKGEFTKAYTNFDFFFTPNAMANGKYINYNSFFGRKAWMITKNVGIAIPVAFCDGWHLSKSIMLWCMCIGAGISLYNPLFNWPWYVQILLIRSCFGFGFVLFYNYLLLSKTWERQ